MNKQGHTSCSIPQVSISKLLPLGEGQLALLVLLAAFGIVPFCFARMTSSPPLLFIWGLLACVIYGVIIVYSHFTVDAQLVWTQVRDWALWSLRVPASSHFSEVRAVSVCAQDVSAPAQVSSGNGEHIFVRPGALCPAPSMQRPGDMHSRHGW